METRKTIPENKKGKSNDLTATTALNSHELAVDKYNQAKTRMLNPSVWNDLIEGLGAAFELVDNAGNSLYRNAETGDYVKIDIPGPGPQAGSGYDWVVVEKIEERHSGKEQECSMRLRPSAPPFDKEGPTAHFFTDAASSTFIIERMNNLVLATYHGRNEVPNVETGKVEDNVRNAAVSAGAMAGLSEVQWLALIKAFLADS